MATVVSGIAFPECMRWHDGQLWFSDVLAGMVYRLDPKTSQIIEVARLPCMAGGLSPFLDLSNDWEHPANDMFVDSDETIWIGGYGYDPETEAPQVSSLARYRSGVLDFPVGDLVFPRGKDESRILIDLPGEILALSVGVQGRLK